MDTKTNMNGKIQVEETIEIRIELDMIEEQNYITETFR